MNQDLNIANEANQDALQLLRAIDNWQTSTIGIDIEAIRKRVTLRHYEMVARLAALAKTAEKQ
jgi:RIO-like serine/threonine protein kinase